jgi:hypothetical protein
MVFIPKSYTGITYTTGKEAFGQFRRVQNASDYISSKKAKNIYCRQNSCFPKTTTLSKGDYLLKYFYEVDSLRSIKTDLANGLITKLDLKGVSVIKNTQTGKSPTTISKDSVPYLNYTIDPSGSLFGNTTCGLNNFENYLIYDFFDINTYDNTNDNTYDNINEENLLNIQTSTELYSQPTTQIFTGEELIQPSAQISGEPTMFTSSQEYEQSDNQTIEQSFGESNIQRLIQVFGQSNIQRIPLPSSKPIVQRSFQPSNQPSRQPPSIQPPSRQPPSQSNIQQNT